MTSTTTMPTVYDLIERACTPEAAADRDELRRTALRLLDTVETLLTQAEPHLELERRFVRELPEELHGGVRDLLGTFADPLQSIAANIDRALGN